MPFYVDRAISFGPFILHRAEKSLIEAGREIRLGARTLDLLVALVERAGEVVSKQALIACVWGDGAVEETTLRAHIAVLRTVLGEGQSGQRYIVNVAGKGYCFVAAAQVHRADATPANASTGVPCHNLPDLVTRVIGRDGVVATISEQLARRRFICITAPGGMGKTTVAVAVAEQLLAHYPDGIRFVDLSLIADPSLVATAVAGVLDAAVTSDQPLAALSRFLSDKAMLVVLDNCEHVADAAAEIAVGLLKAAPKLNVLATSREPLRAEGEWIQRLPPLEAPPAGSELTAAQALAFPAVRLFTERAIASVDSFTLTDKDAELACEICRRLDGMPLAIELAAARIAAFGIRGLMRAIDDRLDVFRSRQRSGLARHRTLVALLDWSHEMLPPAERATFRRLSVFRGGFSLESARAVATHDGTNARKIVEAVASLAAKSLIFAEIRHREVHYRMLETTRDYAAMQLSQSQEVSATRLLHALRICDLLEGAGDLQRALEQAGWIVASAWLIGDVRSALDWALGPDGDTAVGVRLAAAVLPLCSHLSLYEEFHGRVGLALERARELQPPIPLMEMRLSASFASMSYHTRGPTKAMASAFDRSLTLAVLPELIEQRGEALHGAWASAFAQGAYDRALALADALASVAQPPSPSRPPLLVERIRAQTLHFCGQHVRARTLAEHLIDHASPPIRPVAGESVVIGRDVSMRILLARIHWLQGRPEQAASVAQECVELAAGDVSYALCQALAFAACPIALWMGDHAAARNFAERLIRYSIDRKVRYWQCWGSNLMQVVSAREHTDTGRHATHPPVLVVDGDDHKQRDLLGTLGLFSGDMQALERARNGGGWCAAEILRRHGEWLIDQGDGNIELARQLFRQALAIARAQGALSWELRASMSLARLMRVSGFRSDAWALLSATYNRFEEGFASADLLEAGRLLDDPSGRS